VIVRTALVGVALTSMISATPVSAAEPPLCSFDVDTGVVEVVLPVQAGSTPVVLARLGGAIAVDGAACGDATVTNTESISVTGLTEPEGTGHVFTIDLSGGPFAPGRTDEGDGSSEIEMAVDMGPSTPDLLTIVGSSGPDAITIRNANVDLDAAPDAVPDLVLAGLEDGGCGSGSDCWVDEVRMSSGAGADRLILRNGDGGVSRGPIDAGPGPDRVVADAGAVTGGDGNDVMRNLNVAGFSGGRGDDRLVGAQDSAYSFLSGGSGRDLLIGGGGDDWLTGGPNSDVLEGQGGIDRLYGELARDRLTGGEGPDMLFGGPALDRCDVDPADTRVISCNRPLRTG
jgi:Ca2+-binding RTX toxin-like protein